MPEVFAGTSGWANFFVRTEPYYAQAAALMIWWQQQGQRVVATNYVLTKLVALFKTPLRVPRPTAIHYIEIIQRASWVEIVHIDPALDSEAWALLKARQDKEWSLVDCASFVVMRQRGMTEALTTDAHFEQAGFVRLLKP